MSGANKAASRPLRRKLPISDLRSASVMWENLYTGPEHTAAGMDRQHSNTTQCHPMSPSQETVIAGSAPLRTGPSYTTTTLLTSTSTMDPVLPLNIIKRKKVAPLQHHHKGKCTTAQQAPLEVVQEEPEPSSSASSAYSFNLSHSSSSSSSPRSSCDSKRSVSTTATSVAPSLLDDSPDDKQVTTPPHNQPNMPCGTSFLHMGPPTPLSMSPIPPSSPKPLRPPRNPLRQQRKPVPTAPLPPTPSEQQPSQPLPKKVAPPPIIIQTPHTQLLRPQQSEPQLASPVVRPATAPHRATFSSSSTSSTSTSTSPSYYDPSRNSSTTSLSSTRTSKTTSNVALTPFEKRTADALHASPSRARSNEASDAPPVFVYAFLSDSIILSLLFTRDLQKDVQKQPARIVSGYDLSVLEGGRSNYPLLSTSSSSAAPQTAVEGFLIYDLSPSDRRKIQDFPFHPHWRRASTPQTTTPLFETIQVDVDDGSGRLVKATTIAWRKDVSKMTGLKLIRKSWDVEKGRKACVAAYLSVYCSPEKSAERLNLKKKEKELKRQASCLKADDDVAVAALRNVKSVVNVRSVAV